MNLDLTLDSQSREMSKNNKRIHEIDLIRGILILIVVLDHLIYCFCIFSSSWFEITSNPFWYEVANNLNWYWNSLPRIIIREIFLVSFCLISGISTRFSRNNFRRAGILIILYALIRVGTNLLQASKLLGDTVVVIDFNIIGVLAFSTLFFSLVQYKSLRLLIASTLFWILFSSYTMDVIRTIPDINNIRLPSLIEPNYPCADWMPLTPYIIFFFLGSIIAYKYYQNKVSRFTKYEWEKPFLFLGKHSLWIYLGHQIVFTPAFALITLLLRVSYGK